MTSNRLSRQFLYEDLGQMRLVLLDREEKTTVRSCIRYKDTPETLNHLLCTCSSLAEGVFCV